MHDTEARCTDEVVLSSDWELTSGTGAKDTIEDLQQYIPADARETIKLLLQTASSSRMKLATIFSLLKPGLTSTVLIIMAHTAQVNAAAQPDLDTLYECRRHLSVHSVRTCSLCHQESNQV
jgi:hypothetical protein